MKPAEVVLVLAVAASPIALGLLTAARRKPWWWASLGAAVAATTAAIAPTPEPGESRVEAGDLLFLLVVAFWVSGLAWLAHISARRAGLGRDRSAAP